MNIKRIIRSHDWWTPKVTILLSLACADTLIENVNFFLTSYWVLFLLTSLITGAAYVSIINDITDIEEDRAAGKNNGMANFSKSQRWAIAGFLLAAGLAFSYFFYPDWLSLCLYLMSWIVFSLYSIPPVRLKVRGLWGVFADASGAHLFPGCLIVSSLNYFMAKPINWIWFTAVAVWSLMVGLRGILSHQFHDRENDITAGINTYATKVSPANFKAKANMLLFIELASLALMLITISNVLLIIFLILYIASLILRHKLYKTRPMIVVLDKGNHQLVMGEFYQVFFPISLLISITIHQPYGWIFLLLYIAVFIKIINQTINGIFKINPLRRIIKT